VQARASSAARVALSIATGVLVASTQPPAQAQTPLSALYPRRASAPVGTASFALADLDQDGRPDALTAPGNAPLVALRGDGQGGFEPWLELAYTDPGKAFALADFDHDGRRDVAAARTTAALTLFRGLAASGFQQLGTIALPVVPSALASGDCDGDGALDLAWLSGWQALGLLRGDGALGFQAANTQALGDASALECVDLDGDGRVEPVHAERPTVHTGELVRHACDTQGQLAPGSSLYAGELLYAWASGDLDLDGDLDIVLQEEPSLDLRVLSNDGSGAFVLASTTSASRRSHGLAIADANQDGRPDLASAADGALTSDPAVELWIGLASLQLGPKLVFPDLPAPSGIAVFDLNADGRADITAGHAGSGARFSVVQGHAGGGFQVPTRVPLSAAPFALAHADFDRDGHADLAALDGSGVTYAQANGLGGFGSSALALPAPASGGIAVGDWNLDGEPDLACGTNSGVALLHGDGHGAFAGAGAFSTGFPIEWLGAADFDQDGRTDLAAARFATPRLALLPATSSGFAAALTLVPPTTLASVALGHANADLFPDLLACTTTSASMRLYSGGPAFQFTQQSLAKAGFQREVAFVDLDADGDDDLVAGNGGPTVWKLQQGATGWSGAWSTSSDLLSSALAVGDVHGDGRVDLVGAFDPLGLVRVLAGAAGPAFNTTYESVGPGLTRGCALLDTDADGRLEVLIGDAQRSELWVYPNGASDAAGASAFGTGTSGCDGLGGLAANGTLAVGGSLRVLASNAPPASIGFGLVAAGALPSGADPFGIGIVLHVDVLAGAPFLFAWRSDASGVASRAFSIPPDPLLAGVAIPLQAFWPWSASAGCDPSPLLLSSSRGLQLVIGP
jgi:hypothetical protein